MDGHRSSLVIGHHELIIAKGEPLFFWVNGCDGFQVTLEDFPVVVIDLMDQAIAHSEDDAASVEFYFLRIGGVIRAWKTWLRLRFPAVP